jgi:hypothetical protein
MGLDTRRVLIGSPDAVSLCAPQRNCHRISQLVRMVVRMLTHGGVHRVHVLEHDVQQGQCSRRQIALHPSQGIP